MHRAPRARGVAVVAPGFLDGKDGPAVSGLARALPRIGITGVTFDPRGTWGSPGDPGDTGLTTQLTDIARLVGRYAAGRLVLIGHCYGALLAVLAAAANPRVTDVVALMPTRCFIWPEDYDAARDTWRHDGERVFVREQDGDLRRFRVPYTVVEDARRHDLPAALGRLRQRILFVAGADDTLVAPATAARLHDGCGSPDKHLEVLPGVQHDYRDHPDQIETVNRVVTHWLTMQSNQQQCSYDAAHGNRDHHQERP